MPNQHQLRQPPKTIKQVRGKTGEDTAVEFLLGKGYKILERNFKKRYGEIDIVAMDRGTLVFIEVKTRYSKTFGLPEDAITSWKIHALMRSAQYYRLIHQDLPEDMRIDLVAIEMQANEKIKRIELIKNITM